jgi:glycosyltransferase involved in cell wall biosynthesis
MIVLFLPARNEAATVGAVVRRTPARVRGHEVRCFVVDDGSTDATADEAAAAGAAVVSLGRNCGLGAAVRVGLHEAVRLAPAGTVAAIAFCDADAEYAPEELEHLVAPILEGDADYVVGSRFGGNERRMTKWRTLGNRTLTAGTRAVIGAPITDAQSGYRAMSAAAARRAAIVHDYNYAQVLTVDLVGKGFRYAEVPISYRRRVHGRSFVRLVPYLAHVVPAVWRAKRAVRHAATAQSSTTLERKPATARPQLS